MKNKTIKQIANELNITTQTVYYKINNSMKNELQKYVKKEYGQTYVDDKGFNIIKESLQKMQNDDQTLQKNKDIANDLQKEDGGNIEFTNDLQNIASVYIEKKYLFEQNISLNGQIKFLEKEMDAKNKLIEIMAEEIKKEHEMLEIERKHTREQSDKIMSLAEQLTELNRNNQILLREAQEKTTILLPEKFEETTSEEAAEKKRGFLKKMFGKNR